ncbi:MAG: apolipoprotein N-acyltransferase [Ignavibacteriaceae bacterium]
MNLKIWRNRIHLSPAEKKERWKERLLLILSGALMGIAFPPFPFPFTLFLFVGLIPYFIVIEKKKTLAGINRATYLTFFVFSVITLYWVGSWQKESDPFLMIAGGTLLFFEPILFLIPSTLLYLTRKSFSNTAALFLFPIFWATYEYLYMLTDISFPWLTLGHGLAEFIPFIQIADTVGAVGLSIIVIYINIFFYKSFTSINTSKKKFIINLSAAILIYIFVLTYGFYRLENFHVSNKTIKVGLIQPNLNPWDKWNDNNLNNLTKKYLDLSQQAVNKGARLIIWPETALPVFLMDGSYGFILDSIYSFLRRNNVYLLTGMPDVKYFYPGEKVPDDAKTNEIGNVYYATYNGILLLSPDTRMIQRYGKMKLVPFGERVPFVDQLPFLGKLIRWGVGISGWNVGKDTIDFKLPDIEDSKNSISNNSKDSLSINGLICYESVFPYFVTSFVQRGAKLIAIVTNDSWYGKSSGPYQHKEIAVLRAVENRRTVVRAANGGISCIINPLGETKIESKLFTTAVVVGDAPLESSDTFFTKNPLIIPVICLAISLWIFGIFIMKKIKEKLL